MATIIGTIGKDFLNGTNAADTIKGLAGDDVFDGKNGLDKIFGGAGNDILQGGAGPDQLRGGLGSDWTSYVGSPVGVNVNLFSNYGLGGHANGDTFNSIENIRGSLFIDQLAGTHGNNIIEGLAGTDLVYGGGGDDIIRLGPGADLVDAGSGNDLIDPGNGIFADNIYGNTGIDTVDYSKATGGVLAFLSVNVSGGAALGDLYSAVESVIGSKFADSLTPANGGTAFGGLGDDFLSDPVAGVVTLVGGPGHDTWNGFGFAAGHVQLQYNQGWDTLDQFWRTDGDKLLVDHREFGLGSELDPIQLLNLAAGAPVANINSGQFIFIDSTNTLFFDMDGTGAQFAPLKIATVDIQGLGPTTLAVGDFLFI